MKLCHLKTIGEAVGILAVAASINSLGLENKQGNDIARATMNHDPVASWNAVRDLVIGDPVAADLVYRTGQEDATSTPVEQTQIEVLLAGHGAEPRGQVVRELSEPEFSARGTRSISPKRGLIDRPTYLPARRTCAGRWRDIERQFRTGVS